MPLPRNSADNPPLWPHGDTNFPLSSSWSSVLKNLHQYAEMKLHIIYRLHKRPLSQTKMEDKATSGAAVTQITATAAHTHTYTHAGSSMGFMLYKEFHTSWWCVSRKWEHSHTLIHIECVAEKHNSLSHTQTHTYTNTHTQSKQSVSQQQFALFFLIPTLVDANSKGEGDEKRQWE